MNCKLKKNWNKKACKLTLLKCSPNEVYHQGVCKNSRNKSQRVRQIRSDMARINKLIFSPTKQQTDPELMEIVVLRGKQHHFDFLQGKTSIKAVGDWREGKTKFPKESNIVLQVQFNDKRNESVGKELTKRFKRLNKNLTGEMLLYTRTSAIEETSL